MRRIVPRKGFTIIELMVVIGILGVIVALGLAAIQKARDAAARSTCINSLHQIGMALQAYHDLKGSFPPAYNNFSQDSHLSYKYSRLSWLAMILPFVGQQSLWDQTEAMEIIDSRPPPCQDVPFPYNWSFPYDQCPDGTQRYRALETPIALFICPADPRPLQTYTVDQLRVAMTDYVAVSGPDIYAWSLNVPPHQSTHIPDVPGILVPGSKYDFAVGQSTGAADNTGTKLTEVTDGTSNTLLVGERPYAAPFQFGWWFANDGQNGASGVCGTFMGTNEVNLQNSGIEELDHCSPGPYAFSPGAIDNPCDQFHFWSFHSGGANFLFADISVRFLGYDAAKILPALATKAGGEVVDTLP
jgi:prepilin-type N-terminal cleavage/methylation domain-containing protein/prepilin-type processing-associated H-X9-DG protein